jgi:hypothetical protein
MAAALLEGEHHRRNLLRRRARLGPGLDVLADVVVLAEDAAQVAVACRSVALRTAHQRGLDSTEVLATLVRARAPIVSPHFYPATVSVN